MRYNQRQMVELCPFIKAVYGLQTNKALHVDSYLIHLNYMDHNAKQKVTSLYSAPVCCQSATDSRGVPDGGGYRLSTAL